MKVRRVDRWTLDVENYRLDFPILQQATPHGHALAYLDNAASTQHPRVVIDAMSECYEEYYANVHRGIHLLSEQATERYEQARGVVADFLNTDSLREVIFTSGTTAAINLVARAWGETQIGAGDTILLTIAEHHANIVPWQQLAAKVGATIHFVPLAEDGRIEVELTARMLDELRPKLFAFTAVSNVLGTIMPVAELVRAAHAFGAVTLVDAAQGVPHMPVDVRAWDADFVVFSGHKICGPTGIGVLYGRESILASMPPFLGGGGMIHRVTVDGFEPAELPEKFEAGTPPIVEAIGLAAALRYVQSVGLQRIAQYDRELVSRAEEGLGGVPGVKILAPGCAERGGILSFVVDGVHAHDVAQSLDRRGVAIRAGHHCAMPLHQSLQVSASNRASFYFYNTPAEVDLLVEGVAEARLRFAPRGRKRSAPH